MGYQQASQALDGLRTQAGAVDGEIVCGDLNVTPESDVIAALLAAGFNYAHHGCDGVRTCNSSREPKLIDYLFYRGFLGALPVLPDSIDEDTVLPSAEMPSDHLPLVAKFEWAD
jgi:endonuclease/exonuclease/phosphatase (EEP) superfamily protein YafD